MGLILINYSNEWRIQSVRHRSPRLAQLSISIHRQTHAHSFRSLEGPLHQPTLIFGIGRHHQQARPKREKTGTREKQIQCQKLPRKKEKQYWSNEKTTLTALSIECHFEKPKDM